MENNTQECKLFSLFKQSTNGKAMVYGPNGNNPNGKGIMDPMEYVLMVHSPNGQGMVLRKIVFQRDNCHGKR